MVGVIGCVGGSGCLDLSAEMWVWGIVGTGWWIVRGGGGRWGSEEWVAGRVGGVGESVYVVGSWVGSVVTGGAQGAFWWLFR